MLKKSLLSQINTKSKIYGHCYICQKKKKKSFFLEREICWRTQWKSAVCAPAVGSICFVSQTIKPEGRVAAERCLLCSCESELSTFACPECWNSVECGSFKSTSWLISIRDKALLWFGGALEVADQDLQKSPRIPPHRQEPELSPSCRCLSPSLERSHS